mgnify:CR=1 FL=1
MQGDPALNLESAVHIIKPAGLPYKAAICEFDYKGTGFTVVQNRHNDTGRFTGDFENGFGTTVGYDDAECAVANYYLGNNYIKAITKSDSSLKVKLIFLEIVLVFLTQFRFSYIINSFGKLWS